MSKTTLILEGSVNEKNGNFMIDSGSSVTLVKRSYVSSLPTAPERINLVTMNGETINVFESVILNKVSVGETGSCTEKLKAYVLERLPLNLDLVIGLDVILKHGLFISPMSDDGRFEVTLGESRVPSKNPESLNLSKIQPPNKVASGKNEPVSTANFGTFVKTDSLDGRKFESEGNLANLVTNDTFENEILLKEDDMHVEFCNKDWVVKWMWKNGAPPKKCHKANYTVPSQDQEAFDKEIETWVNDGILVPWNEQRDGELKNVIPLMSVKQQKGEVIKIRPVLDFRYLNDHIVSRPGAATPLCQSRLREWRKFGPNCAVVDLKKAYLQIKIDPSLWCYQGVRWKGQTFVLTRLGFGLNIAPKVMTKIVEYILADNSTIRNAASSYIDDIFVNEDRVPVQSVVEHLEKFGLVTKPAEVLGDQESVRVLGLSVDRHFQWKRDGQLPKMADLMTRRQIHKILGEWIGHYPVCGWLRVASGYIQRLTAKEGVGWDEKVSQETMNKVKQVSERLLSGEDPVKGKWLAREDGKMTVWTDASNLALGVVITIDGVIVEDAAWLRKIGDSSHINLSELDAAIRGINMAIRWGWKRFTLKTDSATVKSWLNAALHDTHNVRTHALSEMLIRRRIDILRELRKQEDLVVFVEQVRSEDNLADRVTRIPKRWLAASEMTAAFVETAMENDEGNEIEEIHVRHHFGTERTYELVKEKFGTRFSKAEVKRVVDNCDRCARICPAVRQQHEKGKLSSNKVWSQLSTDITHFNGKSYLTIIDRGSRYCLWKSLVNETAREIVGKLNQVFAEFGPPGFLLSDNGTVYRSSEFQRLMKRWDVVHEFSCAYRPQGNGISERNHRTIKTMAARSSNSIEECVFWYNNTTNCNTTSPPYTLLFHAKPKMPGVNAERAEKCVSLDETDEKESERTRDGNPYVVGEQVYARTDGKCTSEWSGPHVVTAVKSAVSVELDEDGVTRHVSHLRRVPRAAINEVEFSSSSDSEDDTVFQTVSHVVPQQEFRLTSDSEDLSERGNPTDAYNSRVTSTFPVELRGTSPASDTETDFNHAVHGAHGAQPRRSSRRRRTPSYLSDYVT